MLDVVSPVGYASFQIERKQLDVHIVEVLTSILHQKKLNVGKVVALDREETVNSHKQRLVVETNDVVDVRVKDLEHGPHLLLLKGFDYEFLVMGKEEKGPTLALRLSCLEHVVPILHHRQGLLNLLEGNPVFIK